MSKLPFRITMCWQKLFNNLRFLTQIKKNELQGWFCWFLFLPACISLKQMEIDACKTAYTIWEDIQDAKIFQIGRLFFVWKKTTTLYVYFNLTVGAGREGIHCLLCSEMNWQKTPAKTVPNSLSLHKHTKKIRASTVQVHFFCNWSPFLDFRLFFCCQTSWGRDTFRSLKLIFLECIFVQPTTHPHVGVFLLGLATLKSSLKISK